MKAVLGLKLSPWHDTGAAIVFEEGAELRVVAISQERLDRVKNSRAFPEAAINYCLDMAHCRLTDLSLVVSDFIVSPRAKDSFSKFPDARLPEKLAFFEYLEKITAVQDRGQQMRHVLKTWDLGRGSGV